MLTATNLAPLVRAMLDSGLRACCQPPSQGSYTDLGTVVFSHPELALLVLMRLPADPNEDDLARASLTIQYRPRSADPGVKLVSSLAHTATTGGPLDVLGVGHDFYTDDDGTRRSLGAVIDLGWNQEGDSGDGEPASMEAWAGAVADVVDSMVVSGGVGVMFDLLDLETWLDSPQRPRWQTLRQSHVLKALCRLHRNGQLAAEACYFPRQPFISANKTVIWPPPQS